ncbi:hypothetical protein AUR04nite_22210 [Glutamicibacter uratoxydans]|uniref:DUF304 domain-containing protein n=1 Tax=Glutamicibacter uratoxydans TaxID=43667 RepID=A0A4Y4DMY7_GLUUR|nr:hypothetical protein [Glutamicibacter uratoxydans]GED06689.1 hypothetical protein AUR04nite_22210 [Glutamicibacter uratoxydans]
MKVPLHEKERVIISTREHSRVLFQPLTAFLLLTVLCTFVLGYLSRNDLSSWLSQNAGLWQVVTLVLYGVLVLIWCVAPWVRWLRSRIVLTTERIFFRSSLNPGKLQSVGLFTIRDLIAYTKKQNSMTRAGTLDIVLSHGYVRLAHIPSVPYFRTLAIESMANLRNARIPAQAEASNSEGMGQ